MAKYTKSYSNYVLRKKHQLTKDGTIYERDITTIGGRENMSSGQFPIYRTGNFVITINGEERNNSTVSPTSIWENNKGNDVWTLNNMVGNVVDTTASDDNTIRIKKDRFDLRDFAYFGSITERLRTSVLDILKIFPGEFYLPYTQTTIYKNTRQYQDGGETVTNVDIYHSEEEIIQAFGELPDFDSSWEIINVTDGIPAYIDNEGSTRLGCSRFVFKIKPTDSEVDAASGQVTTTVIKSADFGKDYDKTGNYGNCLSLLHNPFGLDMVYTDQQDENNPIKYLMTEDNYLHYDLITEDGEHHVFSLEQHLNEKLIENKCPGQHIGYINLKVYKTTKMFNVSGDGITYSAETHTFNVSSLDQTVVTNVVESSFDSDYDYDLGGENGFNIQVYVGGNGEFVYLVDIDEWQPLWGCHIRPKQEYFEYFLDSLDELEQEMVNPNTDPIYTMKLNVIEENDFGATTHQESFTFPTTYGGYNLSTEGGAYNDYLESLARIGNHYDERFCDNIWRSMTHEAIKNLDWSRNKYEDNSDIYAEAYGKIERTIRVIGRFFDDIKNYIDNLKNVHRVTYDNVNNLPDYFFTDKATEFGWDCAQVIPFTLKEFVDDSQFSSNFDVTVTDATRRRKMETSNGSSESFKLIRKFHQASDSDDIITPYFGYKAKTGFLGCFSLLTGATTGTSEGGTVRPRSSKKGGGVVIGDDEIHEHENETKSVHWIVGDLSKNKMIDDSGNLIRRIEQFVSTMAFTYPEVHNEFVKRLIMNSKAILRKKGTIEGVEEILGLFGMKSKRYADTFGLSGYDFDISEMVVVAESALTDTYSETLNEYFYESINDAKDITYSTYESVNGLPFPYQGLPVIYTEDEETKTRQLYPNFDKNDTYDGDPYYQMNGGWMRKTPYVYDNDYNMISTANIVKPLYEETIKDIMVVDDVKALMNLEPNKIADGKVVYMNNLEGEYAIVDGIVYDLYVTGYDNDARKFFMVTVVDNGVSVGRTYFTDTVTVSDPYSTNGLRKYTLTNNELNGTQIRIYINENDEEGSIATVFSDEDSVSRVSLYKGKDRIGNNYSNYFILQNEVYADEISEFGWKQIKKTETDYYNLNHLKNDFVGNNPHTGNFNYDNGVAYLKTFTQLFRYTIDNNLFNSNLYYNSDLYPETIDEIISGFGFSISGINYPSDEYTENDCIYDYPTIKDDKVYIACDLLMKNGNKVKAKDYLVTDNGTINNVPAKAPITNLIINTKRIDIDVYMKNSDLYCNDGQCEMMYWEKVIMPYLTQMIPSSCIAKINYKPAQ